MQKHLQKLLLLVAMMLVPWVTQAQSLGEYTYSTGTDTTKWIDMSSATQILSPSGSDGLASSLQNIGFVFDFGSESYTQYSVNTDGNLRLGSTVTGTGNYSTPFSSSNANTNSPKINAFGCDGYGVSGSHYVKSLNTVNANGDSLLAVEFCMGTYNSTTRNNLYKWQVHLYHNGNIEIVYGAVPSAMPNVARQPGLCVDATDGWTIDASHVATHFTSGVSSTTVATGTWPEEGRYYCFTTPVYDCPRPYGIVVSNLSVSGFDVTWTDTSSATSWIVQLNAGDSIIYNNVEYANSVSFTGLNPATYYSLQIAGLCAGGDTSMARACTIVTPCALLTTLPYTQNFDDVAGATGTSLATNNLPVCWANHNTGTNSSYHGYPIVYSSSSTAHSGSNAMRFYTYITAGTYSDQIAIMPPTDSTVLPLSSMQVRFWMRSTSTSYNSHVIVGVMTDPTDASTFVPVEDVSTNASTTYAEHTVVLASYNGPHGYVAFKAPQPTSSYNALLIDDISLEEAPSCMPVHNLAVTGTTIDSIYLEWSPIGTETEWIVSYGSNEDVVYDTTYAIGELSANTAYTISVRAYCGTDTSIAVTVTARTACGLIDSLPYSYGFEDLATSTSSMTPEIPCWNHINNGTSYPGYPTVNSTTPHSGTRNLYWYASTTSGTYGDYELVVMPAIDTDIYPINTLQLTFWARPSSTSYSPVFHVGVMTDPTDVNTFQQVATVNVQNVTTWQEFTTGFATFTGYGNHIAVRVNRPSSAWYAYTDDFTIEEMPSCTFVDAIHAQTTASAAHLTWSYDETIGTPTGYSVNYRYADDSTATPTNVITTNDHLVLTGLDADTSYWVSVEALCDDGYSTPYTMTFRTQALPCLEWDTTGGAFAGPADTVVLGTPGTSTGHVMPLNQEYNYSYCQHLFLSSEIPVTEPTMFTGIAFDYAYTQPMTHATNCSIYLANTTRSDMMATDSTFVPYSQLQLVYVGPLNCTASGWNYFQFNRGGFLYDGVHNLCVAIVDNSGSSDGTSYIFRYQSVSGSAMTHRVFGSTPYDSAAMDAARAGQSYWRSNTRLTTGGSGNCLTLASCAAPAVNIEMDSMGDYQLTWIPGYQESSWDVDYREQGSSTWTNLALGTTFTNYTILSTDLASNTHYEFRVTANCSDTNISTIVNYTTPCSFLTLPYSYGFEDMATGTSSARPNIPCWNHLNNGTSYYGYPYVYASAAHTGSRGLYWYLTTTTGTYGDYEAVVLPPVNTVTNPINTLQLSFWSKPTSTSYHPVFIVGVMTDPEDINTFQSVATVNVLNSTDWQFFEVPLAAYTGTGRYVAVRANRPSSAWYAYLDDVLLENVPACPRVYDVEAHDITQTDATIAWTPTVATEYEVQYGPAGFTLDSGIIVNSIYDDSVTLTSLNPGTIYDVYVRGICSGDSSNWSFRYQFNTECSYATLPIIENFDAITGSTATSGMANILPPCWDYYNDGSRTNYQGSPYVYTNATYAHSGSNCIRFYSYNSSGDSNQYLILPVFDSNDYVISDLQLSFWLRGNSTSSNYFNNAIVGVMTDPTNEYSFIPYDTILSATTTYTYHEVNFNRYAGPHGRITILFPKPSSSSQYEYGYLDDLMLGPLPNCASVDNLTATYVTSDTVILQWNTGDVETAWEVSYGSFSAVVYDTTYVAFGLTPNTEYTFSVRAICGVGDTSYPVSYTLYTSCVPMAVPFTESFDTWSSTAADPLPNCWEKHTNYSTNYPYASTSYHHSGTKAMYMYSTSTTYSYMVLPQFALPVDSTMVSFWLYKSNTSYPHRLQVGVMTNPADVSTFVQVAEVVPTLSATWEEFEVPLSSYNGTGNRIAIMSPNNEYSYPYLDDLTVTRISACPRVVDLHVVSVMLDSATIAWSDGSNSSWYVEYDTVDFTPGTGHTAISVADSFYTFTGLDSATTYHVYVYPDCGTTIAERHLTFTTLAASPATVPYSCNFEADGVNGWDFIQTGQNNYWVVGNNTNNGGSRSMYVTDNGTTNNYSGSASYSFAVRTFYLSAGGYLVSYDWKANGESSFDFLRVALVPAGTNIIAGNYNGFNNAEAPSGTLPAGGIALDGGGRLNLQTTWQTHTDEITIATPGTYKLVFMWRNDGSVYNNPPAAIDNVSIITNSCPIVTNVTTSSVTTTSITIDWTDVSGASSWEVSYTGNGATSSNIVTAHPTILTGLTPATAYQIRVRPICSATDTGAWCETYVEYTSCDLIVPPYVQDFDAVAGTTYSTAGDLPPCWVGYTNGTSASYMPHVTNGGSYSYSVSGNALTMTSGSASYGDVKYVRLPQFAMPVSTLTMSYWFCTESSTNGTLTVGYMTGTNFATDFVPVVSHAASSASYHSGNGPQPAGTGVYDTVSFENAPDSALYVAFKWVYTSSFYSCCIDNIEVTSTGAICVPPTIVSTTGDYQSATMTWTGTGTDYEVNIKESVATSWPATDIHVTGNTYTFTGLNPATSYTLRVRQDCTLDSLGYSEWVIDGFTTDSLPCLSPDSLNVTAVTNATATLDWVPTGMETAWDVHVWYSGGFDSVYTVTSHPATIGGFSAGITYNAAVRPLCGSGQDVIGDWGDTVTFTTATCPDVTGLGTRDVTANSVEVYWTADPM
ncbi:MAG: choice-of-anchor J domain-containing protein, partial [Bacteroidales bacterium]|nr:choice-of-anchor J domain-containing protein [Bacteroidales bacterium]